VREATNISGIGNVLISGQDSLTILREIFDDALLLDHSFAIQSIGHAVSADLGYTTETIRGKPIDLVIPEFNDKVLPLLRMGYFAHKKIHLVSKWNDLILVKLSGFYSGLLTDINGFIILRCENLEDIQVIQQQLDSKVTEMDHFIYQASHSLRGPLATIRGLINIAKIENDHLQLAFIHQKMEEFASRLDTKLYKLMCFAEADRAKGIPTGVIDQESLKSRLQQEISADKKGTIKIQCKVAEMKRVRVNEHLIELFLVNLTAFIARSSGQAENSINVVITGDESSIEIVIMTSGFDFPLQHILMGEHGYGHLLEQPDLTDVYSAQKVIFRLQGKIGFEMVGEHQVVIKISIPYNFISLSKN
jgi:signal transduction histidine kinase